MAGFTTRNSISAKSLGSLHGADAVGRGLDRGVAGRAGLVLGQRAVGGAEPQRQRQRLAALADLRTGVDVEQPDVLEQLARAVADRVDDALRGDLLADDQATSWNTAGNGDTAGAGSVSVIGMASRSSSTAQVPFGSPDRSTTAGCSWPACPTTVSPTSTSAHRPGCHGRYCAAPQRQLDTGGAADDAHRLERIAGLAPAGRDPTGPRAHAGRPAPRRRAAAGRGSDASSVAISSSVGLRSFGMRSTARVSEVGSTTCCDREQRDVDGTAGHVAAQGFQQPGQQRGGQLRAVGLQRVEHLRGRCGADRRRADPTGRTLPQAGTASAGSRHSR